GDPGQGGELGQGLIEESLAGAGGRRRRGAGQVDGGGEGGLGLVAVVNLEERVEALRHQPGANEQDERERDLEDDQGGAETAAGVADGAATALLERAVE